MLKFWKKDVKYLWSFWVLPFTCYFCWTYHTAIKSTLSEIHMGFLCFCAELLLISFCKLKSCWIINTKF